MARGAIGPLRGRAVRRAAVALPPARLAPWRAGRPLKRWRYVGVYSPELMLCVGDARIGPVPQRWWAVALPDGGLRERTTFSRGGLELDTPWGPPTARPTRLRAGSHGVRIELELDEGPGVETLSPAGAAHIWTRKQACVPVRGTVTVDGATHRLDGALGFVDDSAGYHDRHTAWSWSAGVGTAADGAPVGWNLVAGIHDDPAASERTVWIDGEPRQVGPVAFADDLSTIDGAAGERLAFSEWSRREHSTDALVMASSYTQPFGEFSGTLPGGVELAAGHGVMEHHDVRW